MPQKSNLVVTISDIRKPDEEKVGKEAANLGEMVKLGIPFPSGFVVTTNAYHKFLLENNLLTITKPVRKIKEAIMSKKLTSEIFRAYKRLDRPLKDATVDIYSPFPKKKFKNVKGEANLIQSVKSLWSLFFESSTNHYLSAIVVQKKISTFCSGIMFTIDHSRNDKTKIIIYEGNETGNHYEVSKKNLEIVNKVIEKSRRQVLTENQIIDLAIICKKLQEHYYFPQEVRFAIENNKIFITQTKPITIQVQNSGQEIKAPYRLVQGKAQSHTTNHVSKLLLVGTPASPGIATGYLRIIRRTHDVNKLVSGDVAIITNTKNLKLDQTIRKAGAIVIESNFHRMPDLAITPRFYGKPTIVAATGSSNILKEGLVVTVNGTKGEIYQGSL